MFHAEKKLTFVTVLRSLPNLSLAIPLPDAITSETTSGLVAAVQLRSRVVDYIVRQVCCLVIVFFSKDEKKKYPFEMFSSLSPVSTQGRGLLECVCFVSSLMDL